MTDRRKLTTLDKLKIMVRQAVCPSCGERLGVLTDCEFDHEHQLAMGGSDTLENLFAKHVDCHKVKTKKDAKARAKTRRLTKDTEEFKRRLLAKDEGEQRPQSKWPTRKLQSRNTFQERT